MQKNMKIREAIRKNNLRYWEIAEKLNLNDGNFSRLLRKELIDEKQKEILKIINELKEEQSDAKR